MHLRARNTLLTLVCAVFHFIPFKPKFTHMHNVHVAGIRVKKT